MLFVFGSFIIYSALQGGWLHTCMSRSCESYAPYPHSIGLARASLAARSTATYRARGTRRGIAMTIWILWILLLFFLQWLLAPLAQWLFSKRGPQITAALGPRDEAPPIPVWGGRLERAFRNMMEARFLFIPLALLAEMQPAAHELAARGAALFLVAIYVPAYVSGVPGLRSIARGIGHAGLLMMVCALL